MLCDLLSKNLHFDNLAEEITPSSLLISGYCTCRHMKCASGVILVFKSKDVEADLSL